MGQEQHRLSQGASAGRGHSVIRGNSTVFLTNLEQRSGNATKIAWRAVLDLQPAQAVGSFSDRSALFAVDGVPYTSCCRPTGVANGTAVNVNLEAFKVELQRQYINYVTEDEGMLCGSWDLAW